MGNKKSKGRKVDQLTRIIFTSVRKNFVFVSKTGIKKWKAIFILAFAIGASLSSVLLLQNNLENKSRAETVSLIIQTMKKNGCIADGLLTGSGGDTDNSITLIERSNCLYLHRAVETWVTPPNFSLVQQNMNKIGKDGLIYGMFLAEAVGTNARYYYPDENRNFNFPSMCRGGSQGFWGEGTCKAYFGSPEYRKYIRYITRKAIDLGIQSFMFGQIYFQDNNNLPKSWAGEVISEMRKYASSQGKYIVVGAQTNDITDEKYLRKFDYIEGGVGVDDKGYIERGPCFSRWWKKPGDRCWALLWNDVYASKANNVFLHLDWSGLSYDDMSHFARMDKATRIQTLSYFYRFFTSRNMGFLMPYLAVVYPENGGCYGPNRNFYSPDNKYSCKDENEITAIFQGNKFGNDAKFIGQSVPASMNSNQEYQVSVSVKNTGLEVWTAEKLYRLGSQNPEDNNYWRGRVNLDPQESVEPGATKTFIFTVRAPNLPGTYDFQWKILQENVEWFGDQSENFKVNVSSSPEFPII